MFFVCCSEESARRLSEARQLRQQQQQQQGGGAKAAQSGSDGEEEGSTTKQLTLLIKADTQVRPHNPLLCGDLSHFCLHFVLHVGCNSHSVSIPYFSLSLVVHSTFNHKLHPS